MATIDPNGVLIYQDTDNYTPIQTALNLAQSNLSSILGASTQIVHVSSVGDRDAKATARGSISKANPFVAWRADAADGLQLEYTTNGTTWRTIADKEYYDSLDTGWQSVTLNSGFTAAAPVGVRRIGNIVYWRGVVGRTAGWTTSYINVVAAANFPAGTLMGGSAFALNPSSTSANAIANLNSAGLGIACSLPGANVNLAPIQYPAN